MPVAWRGVVWLRLAWLGSVRIGVVRSVRVDSAWLVVCGLWLVVLACGVWFGCGLATFQEPMTMTKQQVASVFGHTVKPQRALIL